MAQLTINGIEYEVIFVDVGGIPRLRLYNSAGDAYTDILAGEGNNAFKLPSSAAPKGLIGLVVCDEDGNLSIQNPGQFIETMAGTETLAQTQAKINAIISLLRTMNIVETATITIRPDPATLAVNVANNQTITPSPATMALETR